MHDDDRVLLWVNISEFIDMYVVSEAKFSDLGMIGRTGSS